MMQLIRDLWFKERHLISDEYDKALEYISRIIPIKIHTIPTGTKCWTWTIPEKWILEEAWIKDMKGNTVLDVKEHPLHVISYSLPIDKNVAKDELLKHLYTNPDRPNAIPFIFKYYERDWGFCIQHEKLKNFTEQQYQVRITSKFEKGTLKIGELDIKGKTDSIVVLVAHLCHPSMVNDDLTGVAVLVELARQLQNKDNFHSYKILILPETIGSIAYLSQNEKIISKIKYGIFFEMLGNENTLALQKTRQGNTRLDKITRYVMKNKLKESREGEFHKIVVNDEMVFNGPGVNIPMISINRYPYPEYHTSDDNLKIISEDRLSQARDIALEVLDILDKDYIPTRKFKGPVFLSGYGMWVDYRINKKLNENIDEIMLLLEGDMSVFDISEKLEMDFYDVLDFLNKFLEHDLITKKYTF